MNIVYHDGREFELDYDSAKHSYTIAGKKIPAVTRVIDACFPKYLTDWAVKEGADFFKQSLEPYKLAPTEEYGTYMLPAKVIEHIHKGIQTANRTISWDAAQVGNSVHEWIAGAIKLKLNGDDPGLAGSLDGVEQKNCIHAFKKWAFGCDIEWLKAEEKVYYNATLDSNYSFAGTVDAVAMVDGKLCVIDFKTSKKIYKSYYLQVAAYAAAIEMMDGRGLPMGIILRLDKETGEFQEKRFDTKPHIDTFFKCVELKNWNTVRIPEAKWDASIAGPDV
jgi:hypothetical protein